MIYWFVFYCAYAVHILGIYNIIITSVCPSFCATRKCAPYMGTLAAAGSWLAAAGSWLLVVCMWQTWLRWEVGGSGWAWWLDATQLGAMGGACPLGAFSTAGVCRLRAFLYYSCGLLWLKHCANDFVDHITWRVLALFSSMITAVHDEMWRAVVNGLCCRQEVEELRYEQERLRWQLNQATHLGTGSVPMQTPVDPTPTAVSNYCSHTGNDRYVMAKHTAVYPTAEDVSLTNCAVK